MKNLSLIFLIFLCCMLELSAQNNYNIHGIIRGIDSGKLYVLDEKGSYILIARILKMKGLF